MSVIVVRLCDWLGSELRAVRAKLVDEAASLGGRVVVDEAHDVFVRLAGDVLTEGDYERLAARFGFVKAAAGEPPPPPRELTYGERRAAAAQALTDSATKATTAAAVAANPHLFPHLAEQGRTVR